MENTHPISVPVHNPSQITEIFDSISYDKVRGTWYEYEYVIKL